MCGQMLVRIIAALTWKSDSETLHLIQISFSEMRETGT
jgi:hypothetical protein